MSRARYILGVAALSAAVVSGCGSSSKSPSASSLTKPQFLAKGNAICRAGNARLNTESAKLGSSPSSTQIVNYVTTVFIPQIQSQISAIRALGAPKGDESTVSGFMSLAQADLDKVKAKPTLLLTGGPSLFHNFAVKAHAYGLTQCAANS